MEKDSFVLEGGRVIDPLNNIDNVMDVKISNGRIAAVALDLPPDDSLRISAKGFYVVPGLLDIHAHVDTFHSTPSSQVTGLDADAHMFRSGVTTTVDAGSSGWANFEDFKERCIDSSHVRILAFVNIARVGMVDGRSEQNAADLVPEKAAEIAGFFADVIVGIKSAHYWTKNPWDADHQPWTSVDMALEAAELCHKPVMIDFWPRPPERSYQDLLRRLRPGDIHTHVFAQQFPVLDSNGKPNSLLFEARERGIRFDLGHGAASFWFRNAVPALDHGFPPDSLGTDLHMANVNGPVISMLHTMSKYLSMGMPIEEVIARSTIIPARMIGHPELGSLSVGSEADVAVLRQSDGEFGFADCGGGENDRTGNSRMYDDGTIGKGRL